MTETSSGRRVEGILRQLEVHGLHVQLCRLRSREIQDIVDDTQQDLAEISDLLFQIVALLGRKIGFQRQVAIR